MVGEQFAVLMFFAEGKRRYLRRFASAQEACRAFEHCIHSVEAVRFGIPIRVVITDRNDCILREWQFGKGITFPNAREVATRPRRGSECSSARSDSNAQERYE
jgi:hypothetical protein